MISKYSMPGFLCLFLIILWGCSSGDGDQPKGKDHPRSPRVNRSDYAVYLESSGSLNGYLEATGDSSFKHNVFAFLSEVNGLPEKGRLALYDINTAVVAVDTQADAASLDRYFQKMDAAGFRARSQAGKGDQSRSDLKDVIGTILGTTPRGQVSILITDGVFSPGRNVNAQEYLSRQQFGIRNTMAEKLQRQSFSTLVLQYYSGFKGAYYYQDNTVRTGAFQNRPYYIFCFGESELLRSLLSRVQRPGAFAGYRDFLFLDQVDRYDVNAVIRNNGSYYSYNQEQPLTVTDIRRGGQDNKFRLKLRLDLARIPVAESYLADPRNYELGAGYTVASVTRTNADKGSHELVLAADAPRQGSVRLSLKRRLPGWVTAGSLEEDKELSPEQLEGKTFGIRYLLDGMYQAYYAQQPGSDYFSVTISLKE